MGQPSYNDPRIHRGETSQPTPALQPEAPKVDSTLSETLSTCLTSSGSTATVGRNILDKGKSSNVPQLKAATENLEAFFQQHEAMTDAVDSEGGWIKFNDSYDTAYTNLKQNGELPTEGDILKLSAGQGDRLRQAYNAAKENPTPQNKQNLLVAMEASVEAFQEVRMQTIDQLNHFAVVLLAASNPDYEVLLEKLESEPRELNKTDGTTGRSSDNDNQFLPEKHGIQMSNKDKALMIRTFDSVMVALTGDTADHLIDTAKYLEHPAQAFKTGNHMTTPHGKQQFHKLELRMAFTQMYDAFRSGPGEIDGDGWAAKKARILDKAPQSEHQMLNAVFAELEAAEQEIDSAVMDRIIDLAVPEFLSALPEEASSGDGLGIVTAIKNAMSDNKGAFDKLVRNAEASVANEEIVKESATMDAILDGREASELSEDEHLRLAACGARRLRMMPETYYTHGAFNTVVGKKTGQRAAGKLSEFSGRRESLDASMSSDEMELAELNQRITALRAELAPAPVRRRRPWRRETLPGALTPEQRRNKTDELAQLEVASLEKEVVLQRHKRDVVVIEQTEEVTTTTTTEERMICAIENDAMRMRHAAHGETTKAFISASKYPERQLFALEAQVDAQTYRTRVSSALAEVLDRGEGRKISHKLANGELVGRDIQELVIQQLHPSIQEPLLEMRDQVESVIISGLEGLREGTALDDYNTHIATLEETRGASEAADKLEQALMDYVGDTPMADQEVKQSYNILKGSFPEATATNPTELIREVRILRVHAKQELRRLRSVGRAALPPEKRAELVALEKQLYTDIQTAIDGRHVTPAKALRLVKSNDKIPPTRYAALDSAVTLLNSDDAPFTIEEILTSSTKIRELVGMIGSNPRQTRLLKEDLTTYSKTMAAGTAKVDASNEKLSALLEATKNYTTIQEEFEDLMSVAADLEIAKRKRRLGAASTASQLRSVFYDACGGKDNLTAQQRVALKAAIARVNKPHNPGGVWSRMKGSMTRDLSQVNFLATKFLQTPGLFTSPDDIDKFLQATHDEENEGPSIEQRFNEILLARCGFTKSADFHSASDAERRTNALALCRSQDAAIERHHGLKNPHTRTLFLERLESLQYQLTFLPAVEAAPPKDNEVIIWP